MFSSVISAPFSSFSSTLDRQRQANQINKRRVGVGVGTSHSLENSFLPICCSRGCETNVKRRRAQKSNCRSSSQHPAAISSTKSKSQKCINPFTWFLVV